MVTIKASDFNAIQNKVDAIVKLWGGSSPGTTRVSSGDVILAQHMNSWESYLKSLSSRITGGKVSISLNVKRGDYIKKEHIDYLITKGNEVSAWCNRSECNNDECMWYESNDWECNMNESDSGESALGEW